MTEPTRGRLLIVDDETELRLTLCDTLGSRGYEVTGFGDGEEALEALRENEFDLLITDLMMPGIDGIELLRRAFEIDPYLVGLLMTGHGTVQTAVEAMKLGAFDYVLKPFRLQNVQPIIDRAMTMRKLRLENVELREAVGFYELTQALAGTLDLAAILEKVGSTALSLVGADEVSIMLPEPGELLRIAYAVGPGREKLVGQTVSVLDGIAGWVARMREPVSLSGEVRDERFAPIQPRAEIVSSVSLPMLAAGSFGGVLSVNATDSHRQFRPGQIKALTMLAGTVAFAIENARLFQSLDRARAAAEETNRLKDEFLATVSHELRTPMTAVLGWSHMLQQQEGDDSPLAQGIRVIHRNAIAQCRIIDDLLDVSRIVAGKLSYSPQLVDLRSIIEDVAGTVQPAVVEAKVGLLLHIDPPRAMVLGDETRLQQIIENLVLNGIKFTPENGRVEIGLRHADDWFEVTVSDTGQGIEPEFMPHIFDRFRQADASATRRHGGLGLGLSIVHYLVELHHGTIQVHSEGAGKGTCFTVRIPAAEANGG